MTLPTPSYNFVTSAGQRKFCHRWHLNNNKVVECNKCGTTCKETDAYSQHWLLQRTKLIEAGDKLYTWRKTTIMQHKQDIVGQNIESFMLCQGKFKNTVQFVLDACAFAIPDLLNVLFDTNGCTALVVSLRFYVKIENEMYMLQSSELEIKHYYDIRESVDVMFVMMIEKLRIYLSYKLGKEIDVETKNMHRIKRIHIQAQRKQQVNNEPLALPLAFMRKTSMLKNFAITEIQEKQYNIDLQCLTAAFEKYLKSEKSGHFKPPFPCNLYCFQTCAKSYELYAIPYHMSDTPETFLTTRSFIILNDISGRFQQLQEIGNLNQFLQHFPDDKILSCPKCEIMSMHAIKLFIHKELECANNFEISKIDEDFIEIYDNCLEIMRCNKWLLYGIAL